jgi:hypothetical protein
MEERSATKMKLELRNMLDSCKQNMERNVQQKRVPISEKTCRKTFDKKTLVKRKTTNKNENFYE